MDSVMAPTTGWLIGFVPVIRGAAYGRGMTDNEPDTTPEGSTDPTEAQKQHTQDLPDGSPSGDATKDPDQDSDTTSGGEPE